MTAQRYVSILLIFFYTVCASAQKIVTFKTSDELTVTADFYETEQESDKYVILFHQADYSRGEHKESSRRLIKLGFNCLAIDLRVGKEVNYVQNETAIEAQQMGVAISFLDSEKDMIAAIEYVKSLSEDAQIFLLGSSFSASLALKLAKERDDIVATMAFSPGEYFENQFEVRQIITGLRKPTFVACPKSEYAYVSKLVSGVSPNALTLFKPERGDGLHGAKTLWWESSTRNEFWLALLFFLKDFK